MQANIKKSKEIFSDSRMEVSTCFSRRLIRSHAFKDIEEERHLNYSADVTLVFGPFATYLPGNVLIRKPTPVSLHSAVIE